MSETSGPTKIKQKKTKAIEAKVKKTEKGTVNKPENKANSSKKRKSNTEKSNTSTKQKKHKSEVKDTNDIPKASVTKPKKRAKTDDDPDFEDWEDEPSGKPTPNTTFLGKFGVNSEQKVDHLNFDFSHCNLMLLIVDEICLEGLDGITLEALWTRISFTLKQNVPLPNSIKNFAWSLVITRKDIEFFKLEEPRGELKIFDRYKDRDPDLGEVIDPVEIPLDIYPFGPVRDNKILGSALSFETRVDISEEVRLLNLTEVEKRYGSYLVLVGNQRIRKKAIIHSLADPNVEYNNNQYSLLERIGRSRIFGEITQGKVSLQVISKDPKILFYNRKILSENNLITKQPFNIKTPTGHHLSGTLLHLYRFYNEQKTKTLIMTQQIVDVLRNKPGYRVEYAEAKEIFGYTPVLRKLFKLPEFQRFVKTDVPCFCRDLYPNDPLKWTTLSNKDKVVRTLELVNPNVNVVGTWNEEEAKEESSDEETTQELMYNIPILHQVYDFIKLGGREGRSIKDILSNKGLDFYSTRAAVNQLVNLKVIDGVKIDIGRQRQIKYRAINCHPFNLEVSNMENHCEKEQLEVEAISFLSDLLDVDPSYLATSHIQTQTDTMVPDDNYTLIKTLRQQNKQKKENTESMAILMATFRNEHGYVTESNKYVFNADIHLANNICESIVKSHIKPQCSNSQKKKKFTKLLQTLKQKNATEQIDIRTLYKDMNCPLKYQVLMDRETYRKVLTKVLKLSHFLLTTLRYRITEIGPRKNYLCKEQLPWKSLQELGQDHPELNSSISTITKPLRPNIEDVIKITPEDDVTVIKDIYMGPKPTLAYQSVDNDGIEVSVWRSTKPEEFTDSDLRYVKDNNATVRTLKRANWILDAVHQELVITDIYRLHRSVHSQDQEEGYNVKADRKSFQRIYTRLVRSGLIKILQISLKSSKMKRMITVLCDPSLDVHHSIIESVIEQFKLKFFIPKKKDVYPSTSIQQPTSGVIPAFETVEISSSVGELKKLSEEDPQFVPNRSMGREYGYMPKFVRMRALHELLFHVIYNYPYGQEVADVAEMLSECNISLDESEIKELPPIYCREVSWKMFIPVLSSYTGWSEGWGLVCDILLRLPLSIFVKLCNVTFVIPDLPSFLDHPVKQHYLIKHLPSHIRSGLLYRRKYIFAVHETLSRLCYIGLVQFGPQKLREKDQVFIYLNRYATLLDTTTSSAGYHYVQPKEYTPKHFHFITSTDVESYWYEMWNICAHTKLGLRNAVVGTYITIEQLETKAAMVEAIKPQTPDVVVMNDRGIVPGDKRGAAGLDSALWSHIKRNWIWSSLIKQSPRLMQKPSSKKRKLDKTDTRPETDVINCARKSKNKFFIRKVQMRMDKRERRGYDMVDKKLMANLQHCRSEWTYEEDRLLNICKIVSCFLCPNFRKQIVHYTVIRDALHHLLPCSNNKTSGACQRRISVLFGSVEQQEYLQQIVKTLMYIPYVQKYFQKFYEHVQTGMSLAEKQLKGAFVFLVSYFYKHQHKLQHIFEAINLKHQHDTKTQKPKSQAQESDELVTVKRSNQDQQTQLEVLAYDSLDLSIRPNKTPRLYPEIFFPKTETDITLDTIKSIIHSTVASRPDDISCIYQFFRVYQTFSDDLLKTAVNEVRNAQMVIASKRFFSKKQQPEIKGIPITTKLFNFSFYYNFIQITKFPVELFLEAHEMFLGIQTYRDKLTDSSSKGLPMECCLQGHEIGLSEIATKVDSYFVIDFPKEVLILNPSITDHTELIRELAVRYKKMLTLIKNGTFFKDDHHFESSDKGISRRPMIQRFLKTWFLTEDHFETQSEMECNFRDMLFEDESFVKRTDKKLTRTTSEKKSVNLQNLKMPKSSRSENFKTATPDASESFENYEKKLEKLLSSKISDDEDVTSTNQNVKEEKVQNESDDIFNRYLSKNPTQVQNVAEIETVILNERVHESECLIETEQTGTSMMQYLIDDELSVEQIMQEMLIDCPPEERKVPNPINLSRLLVTGLFPDLDEDEERLERLHQHFLINCPDINLILSNFEDDEDLTYLYLEHPLVCKRLLKKVQKDIIASDILPASYEISTKFKKLGSTELDMFVVDSLIDFIAKKHAMGATSKEVKKHFSNLCTKKLSSLLNTLIDLNVILRTGIIYTVFIHYKYRKNWLVESCTLEDKDRLKLNVSKSEETSDVDLPTLAKSFESYKEIKLHLRPWARIDGSLNLKTFEKWLCTILGYCLAESSMSVINIIKHCCFLKPVDIYYLLECLQELGCISLVTYIPQKCSLLSEATYIEPVLANIMDDFEDIYVESDKLAIIKFGAMLNKKLKEFDFSTDISKKHGTF